MQLRKLLPLKTKGSFAGDIAQIDAMVTVVDAPNFLHDFETKEHLVDRGQQLTRRMSVRL